MDIRAKDLLSKVRKIKGCENAIIAGGFVRDTIMGGKKKDIDIFIPSENYDEFEARCLKEIGVHIGWKKNQGYPSFGDDYGIVGSVLLGKLDGKFEGLEVDIMGYRYPNNADFGNNVVSDFQYGVDKVFFDGFTVIETDEFLHDKDTMSASLLKLEGIQWLGHALDKFVRLKEKYPNLRFTTKLLSLTENGTSVSVNNRPFTTERIILDEFIDNDDVDEGWDEDDIDPNDDF